jgi:hypothetical protein
MNKSEDVLNFGCNNFFAMKNQNIARNARTGMKVVPFHSAMENMTILFHYHDE